MELKPIKDIDFKKNTFWEKIAKSKWGSYISEVEERVILKANDLSGIPETALEVGCEGGRWAQLLSNLGWQMICTDINPQTLFICQQRIPQAKCLLVTKEDTTLPCKSESIKLILCIEVIDVLSTSWFITEAFRILQNDGLVVGVFNNKTSFRGYFRHLVSLLRKETDYYKSSYPVWRKKLYRTGFEMQYEEGICWFPFGRDSNSYFIPFCTKMEKLFGLRCFPILSPWIVFIAKKINISQ